MKQTYIFALGAGFACLMSACAPNCSTSITETTKLQNLTGNALEIQLCKVPYSKASGQSDSKTQTRSAVYTFTILQNQNGSFQVDTYTASLDKNADNTCKANAQAAYVSQVFLNATSFNQVKLCRDNVDPTTVTIVGLSAGCPSGTTAQAAAVTTCDDTALIN